jgi:hypothetical protein
MGAMLDTCLAMEIVDVMAHSLVIAAEKTTGRLIGAIRVVEGTTHTRSVCLPP